MKQGKIPKSLFQGGRSHQFLEQVSAVMSITNDAQSNENKIDRAETGSIDRQLNEDSDLEIYIDEQREANEGKNERVREYDELRKSHKVVKRDEEKVEVKGHIKAKSALKHEDQRVSDKLT